MLAPAPALFSITTCCPHTSASRLPTVRAIRSVAPAGTNGTMIRTKRLGQACASAARPMSAGTSADAAESPSKQRRLITAVPPLGFFDPLREAYRREQLATSVRNGVADPR